MILSKLENFDFQAAELVECDLLVVCNGIESRCSDVVKSGKVEAKAMMVGCTSPDLEPLRVEGAASLTSFSNMDDLIAGVDEFLKNTEYKIKVVVDISCLELFFMAALMELLTIAAARLNVELIVLYSIASFSPPTLDRHANESIEPVHSSFAGWSTPESRPTSLVLGLGYEPHKAEGASEFFEPSDQWVFLPRSPVDEFYEVVKENNRSLLEQAEGSRLIEYNVDDPETTYGQLEVVISILLKDSNPVLLPFGPKIFFFLCLMHCLRHPQIGVWRVSKGKYFNSSDVVSSGYMVGVRCVLTGE